MDCDPKIPPYSTSNETSFGYVSARDRWPEFLTNVIDDVHRTTGIISDEEQHTEGKRIVQELAKLKYELQHDRTVTPIPDDGSPDIAAYNDELAQLGNPSWFNSRWLYLECYLFRRIQSIFALSKCWKGYDVFGRQKMSAFRSSRAAVLELAARYKELVLQLESEKTSNTSRTPEEIEAAEKLLFKEMCEICLWGNATDLSLLTSLTYEDLQKLQGSKARQASEQKILVDDLPAAYDALKKAQRNAGNKDRRVDIVLDNAGFELFVDFILAGYLLSADLATTIVLHPKSFPWYISDVTPNDILILLNALADPQAFYQTPSEDDKYAGRTHEPLSEKEMDELAFLFERWSKLHQEGKIVIRPNSFWTQAHSYWRLPTIEPSLFEDLKESELVIFKGDLNYRKLTADVMWDPTTPFPTSLGPLGRNSNVRILALRTCKADVVVGLPPGKDEELRATEGGGGDSGARRWCWSGKWAVVQFCNGKEKNDGA